MTSDHAIPEEIVEAGTRTSAQGLARAAKLWPDALALILDGERLTWSELERDATQWARALTAAGIGPGSRVGILMANSVDYVRMFYAAGMVGACTLTINARFKAADLAYAIDHSEMDILFVGGHALPYQDFRAMLTGLYPELEGWTGAPLKLAEAPRLKTIVNLADPRETSWLTGEAFLAAGTSVAEDDVRAGAAAVSPDTSALMMYSSGTTAHPKACLISHRSLNMIGAAFARRFGLGPAERVYNPLPFFHMSTMLPMAACRASGAAQIATAHFDATAALDVMERERVSFSYLSFPTLVNQLIQHESFASRDLSALRFLHSVGPADLMQRYQRAFPQARYINAYGLTEATGVPVFTDPADPPEDAVHTNGRPFDGNVAKAVDPDTLADLPPGTRGELWLTGYSLFQGYLKDPDATAKTLRTDGWLRTGDMGHVKADGQVVFDGRLKDMLKIGGENVAALEIETYLCSHPEIQIAQVVSVPDDHLFEVAAAYVELIPGSELTPEAIVDHCQGRIASYKVPRYVRIVTEWPMSTTKIQKYKLSRAFSADERIERNASRKAS